ncbi:hypothetical protein OH784_21715 [Ectobacillus funiculus]
MVEQFIFLIIGVQSMSLAGGFLFTVKGTSILLVPHEIIRND